MYRQLLVPFYRTMFHWFASTFSPQMYGIGHQTIKLDLRCVSWMLRTSLDNIVRLSDFNHLLSVPELANFDPVLTIDCFNGFISCIGVSKGKVVVMRGLEQLAAIAAIGFCRTLYCLTVTDPTLIVLTDLCQRYNKVFHPRIDVSKVPFSSTMGLIHALASKKGNPRTIEWGSHRLPIQECVPFARFMVEAAQVGYQQTQGIKVPRWILRFALDYLSQDPPSPTPVVVSCLLITAIDLDCDVSNITTFDGRYVCVTLTNIHISNKGSAHI